MLFDSSSRRGRVPAGLNVNSAVERGFSHAETRRTRRCFSAVCRVFSLSRGDMPLIGSNSKMRLRCGPNLMFIDSTSRRGRVPAGLQRGDMPLIGSNSEMRLRCGPNLMLFDSSSRRGRVPVGVIGYSNVRCALRLRRDHENRWAEKSRVARLNRQQPLSA